MRGSRIAIAAVLLCGALALTGCAQLGGAVNQISGGSVSLNGLPKDWPGDVPIIDGSVTGGAKTGDGWTALVHGTTASALEDAISKLQGFGFSVQSQASSNGTGTATLINGRYQVTLTGSSDGVLYVIAPSK